MKEQKYTSIYNGNEFFLRDHVVNQKKILPGVVYLEMARIAGEVFLDETITTVENICWHQPLIVKNENAKIQTRIVAQESSLNFEITSKENGNYNIHCSGSLKSIVLGEKPKQDLPHLKSKMKNTISGKECYAMFSEGGINYGESFQGIQQLFYNEDEVLSEIKLAQNEQYPFTLGILDAALQTCVGFAIGSNNNLLLPYSVEEITYFAPFPVNVWCYAKKDVNGYRIEVLDVSGTLLFLIKGFVALSATKAIKEVKTTTSKVDFLYKPVWKNFENKKNSEITDDGKHLIISFENQSSFTEKLKNKLEKQGKEVVVTNTITAFDNTVSHLYLLHGLSAENNAELELFGSIRQLIDNKYNENELNITAVTYSTQKANSHDLVSVTGGGIAGFMGSLAKEQQAWKVKILDLDSRNLDEIQLSEILNLPFSSEGIHFAVRNDEIKELKLVPLELSLKKGGIKENGVYVILGGAGGIGKVTTEYLIKNYNASVIWLGRSEKSNAIIELQKQLGVKDCLPEYFSCDATNEKSLKEIYATIMKDYGRINGVFHSALVLNDMAVERMTENDFSKSFLPKSVGTHNLVTVFSQAKPDFICFYSSVQSQINGAGQSNYSAGCTYQDAYAWFQNDSLKIPAKVINWGYWGNVGVVADDKYRAKMSHMGIGSIESEEGMSILEMVLANDILQVAAIKLSENAQKSTGFVDVNSKILPVDQKSEVSIPVIKANKKTFKKEVTTFLETIACMGIIEIFLELGFNDGINDEHISEKLRIKNFRLFEELLRVLLEKKYLTIENNALYIKPEIRQKYLTFQRTESLNLLAENNESYRSHAYLLDQCLSSLKDVLIGEKAGTDVLFPGGSLDLVAGIYKGNEQADFFNGLLAQIVLKAVEDALLECEENEKIHILEVGAGTGGTSELLFTILAPYKERITYLYTDVSKSFLLHADQKYGVSEKYLSTALFDIEKAAYTQGIEIGAYDIVIGANVIHATRNIKNTLKNVKAVLKENGLLIMNEIATNELFNTLTFGLLDGWWLYDDEKIRLKGSPGLDFQGWSNALKDTGYNLTTCFPEKNVFSQQIIVSKSDGFYVFEDQGKKVSVVNQKQRIKNSTTDLDGDLKHKIKLFIRNIVGDVLKIAPDQIDVETPITDYGIDSILGLNVIKEINDKLNTSIATTVLFDYPTVELLTEFFNDTYENQFRTLFSEEKKPELMVKEKNKLSIITEDKRTKRFVSYKSPKGRKLQVTEPGNVDDIELVEFELEEPHEEEVLIAIKSFSLNFGDLLSIKGLYPTIPPFPFTPGFEAAGIILSTGENVTGYQVGDEVIVMGDYYLGMHATHITVNQKRLLKKPEKMSFSEASSMPVVTATMIEAFRRINPKKGERILIQTATGGTGLITVQLAQHFGLDIIATAGHDDKLAYLKNMGIDHVINYRETDFESEVMKITDNQGVEIVVNTLSGNNLQKGINCLSKRGRYVELSMTAIKSAHNIDMSKFSNNQTFIGLDLRKLLVEDSDYGEDLWEECLDLIDKDVLKSTISQSFQFDDYKNAYKSIENRDNIGKIVVEIEHEDNLESKFSGALSQNSELNIAVVGMSGQFGSADDLEEFWKVIENGQSLIKEVPLSRWDPLVHFKKGGPEKGKTYCKKGSFLNEIECFDPSFFRITGIEAENMDPQQRLFLQHCWKSLEDAAISDKEISTSKCGIYVGAVQGDYLQANEYMNIEPSSFWGNSISVLASRISYFLNLKGPAIAIDTACSSSLVAIDLACKSLRSGEIDIALSGGVSIFITPQFYKQSSYAGMLSEDGTCYAFDSRANGFVPGEGVGVLVLKRLEDALKNGDPIYGVIKGSLTNQDGTTSGITAPSMISQKQLEISLYDKYKINPESIELIEAHGTGTSLGDPIEFQALNESFKNYTLKKEFCSLGSVKSNIGHTVMSAGVAGVIKTLLAIKHQVLPPLVNYEVTNPRIDITNSPFKILKTAQKWNTANKRRRAAVSSFGFSGTNAHIVIEEYLEQVNKVEWKNMDYLIPFSAKNKQRLHELLQVNKSFLENDEGLKLVNVAYTLQKGRKAMEERVIFKVSSVGELIKQISDFLIDSSNIIYSGNVKKMRESLHTTPQDLYQKWNADRIAKEWIKGADVDWDKFYAKIKPLRLHLPTYQFAKEKYWLEQIDVEKKVFDSTWLHPLIHKNNSTLSEQKFESTFTGNEFFLADHIVFGEKVLPGVAYLEIAKQAGELSLGTNITTIENIIWSTPFVYSNLEDKITVKISVEENNKIRFGLLSKIGEEHSHAFITNKPIESKADVDLSIIKKRFTKSKKKDEFYEIFAKNSIKYGESFRGVTEVFYNDSEALSHIVLERHSEFTLDPGIFDCALQTTASISFDKVEKVMSLPYSIGQVRIHSILAGEIWCHVMKEENSQLGKYKMTIYDAKGKVLVEIDDFVALPVNQRLSKDESVQTKSKNPVNLTYKSVWERFEPHTFVREVTSRSRVLISGAGKLPLRLTKHLQDHVPNVELLESIYDPLDEVKEVFLFTKITENESIQYVELDMFNTLKELQKTDLINEEIQITVFTNNNLKVLPTDKVKIDGAGISGLIGSLSKEQINWKFRLIDLESDFDGWELINSIPFNEEDVLTCVRNNRLYKRSLVPMVLNEKSSKIKQNGVYVILGGAGGIGTVTTEYLIKNYNAQVIWLGRSTLDNKLEKQLDELEKIGKRPIYIQCDATDYKSVKWAYDNLKMKGYSVNGLFHSAIVLNDKLFTEMSESDYLKSFLPKSAASKNLVDVFSAESLDFVCFYSSLQSQISLPGQANYASGCTFKDSYALQLRDELDIPVNVINWGYWGDVGIVTDEKYKQRMARMGVGSIDANEGMQVLEKAISNNISQMITIKLN